MMEDRLPSAEAFFPFWDKLSEEHRSDLASFASERTFDRGSVILPFKDNCLGLLLVRSGRLRCFIVSDEGKEITLYRLYQFDICLFSASCMMNNIQFDIHIEVEKETEVLVVPASLYHRLNTQSIEFSNYMNQLISSRFSDVMWTLEQILFKKMDSRIAQSLIDQSDAEDSEMLSVTHEAIARDLGTAREVVTRILKYFRNEGLIGLSRGQIEILNRTGLETLAE